MAEENNTPTEKTLSVFEATQAAVLAKLDERTQHIVNTMTDFRGQVDRQIGDLKEDIKFRYNQLKSDSDGRLKEVKEEIDAKLESFSGELDSKVSEEAFSPIRLIVYGLVGLVLITVFGAIVATVVMPPERETRHEIQR